MTRQNVVYTAEYFLHHVEQWILAVTDLGNDLCALHKATRGDADEMLRVATAKPLDVDRLREIQYKQLIEAPQGHMRFAYKTALFLVALNKVARWSKKLIKTEPKYKRPVEAYLASFGDGKDLRDIHEHDDEYFTGGGRSPEKFIVESPDKRLRANATTILINGEEIFLGGKLSVQMMLKAAQQLHAEIIAPTAPKLPPPEVFFWKNPGN